MYYFDQCNHSANVSFTRHHYLINHIYIFVQQELDVKRLSIMIIIIPASAYYKAQYNLMYLKC